MEALSVAWQLVFETVQLDPTDKQKKEKKRKAKATSLSYKLILV